MKQNHKEIFEKIYQKNIWGNGSGAGSTYEYNKKYIEFLENYILQNNIQNVVDLGCGDWQFSQHINWNANYLGIDVVHSVIQENLANYQNHNIDFKTADISDITAISPYVANKDLVLIKDVLQHWHDQEVFEFIEQLTQLNIKNILVTNTYKHFRKPEKNYEPRNLNNKYNYSPLNLTEGIHSVFKFRKVFRFKFKEVYLWKP